MPTLELLTYNVDSPARAASVKTEVTGAPASLTSLNREGDSALAAIGSLSPDVIALQGCNADSIEQETKSWPVNRLIGGINSDKAFLSRHPISRLQTHDLGYGGDCISVDLTFCGKLIHLINLQVSEKSSIRFQQLRTLVGPEVIGRRTFPGTLLVTGDFGGPLIHPTSLLLALYLKQGFHFPLRGDFPAKFPIINRNRLYYIGDVQPVSATPISLREQKTTNRQSGSKHLPVRYTIRINDPFSYVEEQPPSHAKASPARP